MENSPYMEIIVGNRAMRLSDEDALQGLTLVSVETEAESESLGILSFLHENPAKFISYIRKLSPDHQECLLLYYFLSKTQTQVGKFTRQTQTVCSFQIRMAVKALCGLMLFGGDHPTAKQMKPILTAAGWESVELPNPTERETVKLSLSDLIAEYVTCRSFAKIARVHDIHRPSIRRTMRDAATALRDHKNRDAQLLGWWLAEILEKANVVSGACSREVLAKHHAMLLTIPDVCGQFRVRIGEPGWESVFTSKADHK